MKELQIKKYAAALAALFCCAAPLMPACSGAPRVPPDSELLPESPIEGLSLVWRDEFEGSSLDEAKWGYQTGTHDVYHGKESSTKNWGNNELEYYTEDAVEVSDGCLKITAERREYGGMNYTSGRILTRDLFSFTYGYVEAKMQTPAEEGMWPAFWMLPQPTDYSSDKNIYGGWAANGEIDIMEAKGRLQNIVDTTLHFGGNWPNNTWLSESHVLSSSTEEWHTYGLYWREDFIAWYIDGEEVHRILQSQWWSAASDGEAAPFDQPFYLLFDLAVGGNYDGGRAPSSSFEQASMLVDYVRVFQ